MSLNFTILYDAVEYGCVWYILETLQINIYQVILKDLKLILACLWFLIIIWSY